MKIFSTLHQRVQWLLAALERRSLSSRAWHFLGTHFIGGTREMGLPDGFYLDDSDRDADRPSVEEIRKPSVQIAILATEEFRRKLRKGVAIYCIVVGSAACAGIVTAADFIGWTLTEPARLQAQADQAKQLDAMKQEQMQLLQRRPGY